MEDEKGRGFEPRSFDVPAQPCPGCGKRLEQATETSHGHEPQVGDFLVCAECIAPLRVGDGFRMELVRLEDLRKRQRREIKATQQLMRLFWKHRRRVQ